MIIQVRFVSYQYNRWMRAVEKIKKNALSEKENLPRRMSIDYCNLVRKNLLAGKYASTYARYNERYQEWKYKIFRSQGGFWELRGLLLISLKSYKSGNGWFGGIPAGIMDTGNVSWFGKGDRGRPVPIAQYGIWMEYGRRGQPSRPLFRPTLIEYSDTQAIERLDESRIKLRESWR